jgi:hypothetical protein
MCAIEIVLAFLFLYSENWRRGAAVRGSRMFFTSDDER